MVAYFCIPHELQLSVLKIKLIHHVHGVVKVTTDAITNNA
jgi:hypothetical protein